MQLDLLSNLTKIIRELELSQQDLLDLRDHRQRGYMCSRHHYYQEVNTLSSDELSVLNGALEELDKCRLTLDDFRNKIIKNKIRVGNKIIKNKIRVGEDATDK